MLTDEFLRVPVYQIQVKREERQRKDLDLNEHFLSSIRQRGVLQPIVITRDYVLVAGERRLAASIKVGKEDIITRFVDELSTLELQIIELEENLKRTDLSWQDQCNAISRLHAIYLSQDPTWTVTKTGEALGLSQHWITKNLRVAEEMSNPRIHQSEAMTKAYNILSRADDRKNAEALSSLLESGAGIFDFPQDKKEEKPIIEPTVPLESIFQEDFLEWAPKYEGRPFNFIHCDFPYGTSIFTGPFSGQDSHTIYSDEEKEYWDLCKCLCESLDKVMSFTGHLMFWFSMEHYTETIKFFNQNAPDLDFSPFPLIWMKSDNVGIMPDAKRGPRRVYETALVASRNGAVVVKPVANAYASPTDKTWHPSTKPEPMLRHFFQMYVDDTTRLLDPTCGGGSAIRAAESLGADLVIGLEKDKEHCENAKVALRKFRALRSL